VIGGSTLTVLKQKACMDSMTKMLLKLQPTVLQGVELVLMVGHKLTMEQGEVKITSRNIANLPINFNHNILICRLPILNL
jgi:hypothetical protein